MTRTNNRVRGWEIQKVDDRAFSGFQKEGKGKKIKEIRYNGEQVDGWFIKHEQLKEWKELVISTLE